MKLVLIGYGAIAARHLEVFRDLGLGIPASCNRSAEGNRRAEREGGMERTYTDSVVMIEREKPDGILICASFSSLYGLARTLIPLGLPILLEKPPGLHPEETAALAELARRHANPVMVGLNRRFYSIYHRFLAIIGGREAVTSVAVEWSEDPEKMLAAGYTREEVEAFVYANSLHGIDLLTFFAGKVAEPAVWGRNLDESGEALRWQMAVDGVADGGARIHFDSNWDVPGRWRLVVDAPDRRLVSAPMETGFVLTRDAGKVVLEPEEHDAVFKAGFYAQARYFLGVVRGEHGVAWPAASLEESLPGMELAEAMTAACRERHE